MSIIRKLCAITCLGSATLAHPAAAQAPDVDALRAAFRSAAERTDLGNGFQALTVLGATPGISAVAFNVDGPNGGLDLNPYKLSPSYTFEPVYGIKPYVELTVGYLAGKQNVAFGLIPGNPTLAKVEYETFTALGGVGVELEIDERTVVRPIFLGGYSQVRDSATVTGPFATQIALAGNGIAFNVRIDSILLGGALEVEHTRTFEGDINLDTSVRYNFLHDRAYSATDPVLKGSGNFHVFTAGAEFDGPIGISVFSRELRWIAFTSTTFLPGDPGESLGFNWFIEVGGGLEIVDRTVVSGLEGVSIRSSALFGDNVFGWTAGLSLEF